MEMRDEDSAILYRISRRGGGFWINLNSKSMWRGEDGAQ